jgi:hypothetical protein
VDFIDYTNCYNTPKLGIAQKTLESNSVQTHLVELCIEVSHLYRRPVLCAVDMGIFSPFVIANVEYTVQ